MPPLYDWNIVDTAQNPMQSIILTKYAKSLENETK